MGYFKGRVMLLSFMASMGLMAQAMGQTCDQNYDASLTRAFANTVTVIRSGDAQGFLDIVSPDGLTVGADGANVPYATLKSHFSNRSGVYCEVFSCSGKSGVINRNITLIGAQKQIDTKHGTALIIIAANTNNELMLSYKFTTSCKWELNAIGYM